MIAIDITLVSSAPNIPFLLLALTMFSLNPLTKQKNTSNATENTDTHNKHQCAYNGRISAAFNAAIDSYPAPVAAISAATSS